MSRHRSEVERGTKKLSTALKALIRDPGLLLADVFSPISALKAVATRKCSVQKDAIAWLKILYIFATFANNARPFMA